MIDGEKIKFIGKIIEPLDYYQIQPLYMGFLKGKLVTENRISTIEKEIFTNGTNNGYKNDDILLGISYLREIAEDLNKNDECGYIYNHVDKNIMKNLNVNVLVEISMYIEYGSDESCTKRELLGYIKEESGYIQRKFGKSEEDVKNIFEYIKEGAMIGAVEDMENSRGIVHDILRDGADEILSKYKALYENKGSSKSDFDLLNKKIIEIGISNGEKESFIKSFGIEEIKTVAKYRY